MIRMTPTTVLVSMMLAALFIQAASAAEDGSPAAEKLIEQLGRSDFAERELATQMLTARGASALPALRKGLIHPNEEVRRRVKELIPPLEAAIALAPKRITLDGEKRSLPVLLQEIEKRTGYQLKADDVGDKKLYHLEMKRIPFWEALEQIGRETNCVVSVGRGQDPCRLVRREGRTPLVVVQGAFRLELMRIHEDRDIDSTEKEAAKKPGRGDHRLTLTIAVTAEPRFTILTADRPRVEAALDEDEKPFPSPPVPEERELELARLRGDLFRPIFQSPTGIVLQRSSEKAKTIKVLRGTVLVKVVVERKPVVIGDKVFELKGTKCEIGGDTLEITRAEQDKSGRYQIHVTVPAASNEFLALWNERIRLEDADGNRYEIRGHGYRSLGDECDLQFTYDQSTDPKLGPPRRLVIEDWTTFHHSIPFEFKDLPLP